jgi:hypothetical protein
LCVAYGSTPPEAIASVEVLAEALVHACASSGHVRQAELIADRLEELGRVVERPAAEAPSVFSEPEETEVAAGISAIP